MSARMQDVAPEVTDISREPKHIQEMYGAEPGKRSFANNALLARRLIERGVPFVELFHESWDQHGGLVGEFGRTPMTQGGTDGRDHHPNAFTMWLAGGGIKGGVNHGKTDDLGFNAVEDKVHVHDLNATILHQLGFDHTKLTTRFQGRDFHLTDVHGNVVKPILA